jgi:Asp-tRNA(Asn)/Glu-tRNA(Gln) amidotransferase A subunit family amidase
VAFTLAPPAFSLPNGFTRSGLPIGLQIVGRPGDESGIISIAAAFEQARPWKDEHPRLEPDPRARSD